MKDLIIAATTRYTKEQLYNYVESINRCGFSGDKIMVVYDVDDDTIDFLKNNMPYPKNPLKSAENST